MSTPQPPQRSWQLTISSVLVIAGATLMAGSLLTSLYSTDELNILAGLFFLPFPLAFIILQYRGIFQRHPGCAEFAGAMLLAASGILAFIACPVILKSLKNWHLPALASALSFGIPLIMLGLVLLFISRLNFRWEKYLKCHYADTSTRPPKFRFSIRELLGAMALVSVIAGLGVTLPRDDSPRYAEHVSADKVRLNLPDNATDISYAKGFRGTIAYEFTTDEKSFIEWFESGIGSFEAEAAGVPLKQITQPTGIRRYYEFSDSLTGPDYFQISNGLEYYWSEEDRHVHAIFDRDTNRAYYSAAYH